MKHKLTIADYEVSVHLGCSTEEQKYLQPVRVTLDLQYAQLVSGSESDQLADATDYVELTNVIKNTAGKKNYHLVEHLNHEITKSLQKTLTKNKYSGRLVVTVQKVRVPVENLRGGVYFTCEIDI